MRAREGLIRPRCTNEQASMHDMHPWHLFVSTTRYPSEAGSAARASSTHMTLVNKPLIPAPIAAALVSLMKSRREAVEKFFFGLFFMVPTSTCPLTVSCSILLTRIDSLVCGWAWEARPLCRGELALDTGGFHRLPPCERLYDRHFRRNRADGNGWNAPEKGCVCPRKQRSSTRGEERGSETASLTLLGVGAARQTRMQHRLWCAIYFLRNCNCGYGQRP